MSASAKSKKRNYQSNMGKTEVPFLWWLGAAGIALFFLIFPYEQGLFNGVQIGFEARIYKAVIYGLILLFIPAIYLVRKWRLNSHVGILSIAVILVPLIYWISYFSAVSSYYASLKVIICVLLAALFITGLYSAQSVPTRSLVEGGLMVAGELSSGSAYSICSVKTTIKMRYGSLPASIASPRSSNIRTLMQACSLRSSWQVLITRFIAREDTFGS